MRLRSSPFLRVEPVISVPSARSPHTSLPPDKCVDSNSRQTVRFREFMRLAGVRTTLRRGLTVVAALVLLALAPTPSARCSRNRRHRNTRALGPQNVARFAGVHHDARPHGARARVQHAPRPGPRPRRRLLRQQPRAPRRRSPATAGDLRSAGDRARQSPRGRAARPRVGERQPRVERRGSADRADAPRPPSSRVADGAARSRAGTRRRCRKRARRMSASSRAGRARRRLARPASKASKGSTRRRSFRRPPITSTPSCAIWSRATRSTASTSTTRATRPNASTTAAAPSAPFATTSGRSWPPPCDARSTARRPRIRSPIRTRFPAEWKAFRISRLTALVGRLRATVKTARPERARHRRHRSRHSGGPRPPPAGLGRLAAGRARRRGVPDGLHARTRAGSPSRLPRRETSRADAQSGPASAPTGCRRPRRSRTSKPRAASARPASSSSPTTA